MGNWSKRCEFTNDNGARCENNAVAGGGNLSLAYCADHAPCSCGAFLVQNGETIEDYNAMPGEPSEHTRERCR